jgi:tRNA threonylcarbamoyladenosine biosynthesis protein TsaB
VWLAIDTATDRASVAVGVPPAVMASALVTGARRHAAEIVLRIDDVLRRAGAAPDGLAGIIVADGPGSFTGLRIGWAAAKGLAHEHEVPLCATPALLAAAVGAAGRVGPGVIGVAFDALRGQVFGAVYRVQPGTIETLVPASLLTMAELVHQAAERPRVVVGDGAVRSAAAVRDWSGVAPLSLEELAPGAESLLQLAARSVARRGLAPDAEPVYGRPAEAQAKWEARHGRPLPDPTGRSG